MNTAELQDVARRLRFDAIDAIYRAQSGHPGSSLSTMEMLVALYIGGVLKHDPKNPQSDDRDYFLLSNGHACPGWYAVLAEAGYFPKNELQKLRQLDAAAQGHPHRGSLPGVEISSGSLGQGLSVGIGIAAGLKLAGKTSHVYVMMSDGEQQEGSTWEAIMSAPKFGLTNLIAIVDKNKFQIDGATEDVMPGLDPLADKYRAFNWDVQEIDGHQFEEIFSALTKAQRADKPAVIISHTSRGKGVSFMENSDHWHAGAITDEQFATAKKDLGV
ncbi:MAG: transketolase [Candidatus Andersenbacteria bacterium]|nr:transketolase [Candidatus Andersenbacteria bacterium]MBI3251087.1 transketolase [Candidatus Andersenbacteria bacterium]